MALFLAVGRLVLARLLQATALLLALSFVLFGVMAWLPGDPVDLLVASNPALGPADVTRLKKLRGLDKPFPVRWWRWLYGHHEAKVPPSSFELPAVVGVLPGPDRSGARPFTVDVPLSSLASLSHGSLTGLTVSPLPPLSLKDGHLKASLVEAGAVRLLLIVEDAAGQQALWSLPVYVAPQQPDLLPGPQRAGPSILDDTGAQQAGGTEPLRPAAGVDERSGTALRQAATALRPLDPLPTPVSDDDATGQHVVVTAGTPPQVVVVDGAPLVDRDRFQGGVLSGELGWSWATKRPVQELLFGEDVVCGDGLVGPGESCDDRNQIDDDGCASDCQTELSTSTTLDWLDTKLAGWATGLGRVGNTLVLTAPALLLSMLLSLLLGTLAGTRKDGVVDGIVRAFAALCSSVPAFFVALVLILLFAEELRWFPSGGMQSPGIHRQGAAAAVVDRLQHLVLPLLVLVVFWSGRFVRQVRSAVLSSVGSDYVRTARSKGASSSSLLVRHVLPNSALPLVTLLGLSLPTMFGGALLTETVFAWPGLGRLQYDAILQNDSYVAVVVFLLVAAMVLAGSLCADVLVLLLDPRTRSSDGARR